MKALDIIKELEDGKTYYFSATSGYEKHIQRCKGALTELKELIKRSTYLEDVNKNYASTIVSLRSKIEYLEQSKSCNGCKYNIKLINRDMDTGQRLDDLIPKQCWECSRNTRQCDDRYEEKINNEILNPTTILKYRRN